MLKSRALKADMDMCSRPLFGKIILFSLPLVFTGILQLLYNAADIIVVGRFADSNAMAAVGSTGALVNLVINLFIGLSVGALAAMAQAIGSRDEKAAEKIVHTAILVSVIGGVIVGIFGYFMTETFLRWMKTPEDILPLSAIYLKIFFVGMPANLLYNFGASILRACGDTKNPLIFLTLSGLVNVALNLVFVIVFKMSVAGVAWATIIAQAISAVLVVICLSRRKGFGKLTIKRLRIDKGALLKIMRIGLPAGIQSTIFSFSNVIIQSAINSMGNAAMAGSAASASIEGFVYTSMNAVSQAALTFTGQNYGANKRKNCSIVLVQTMAITTVLGLVMGVSSYLAAPWLLKVYNTDPEVIKFGVQRLLVIGTTYFTCGLMEVLVGSLRGIGLSFTPMFVSIVGVCGVRILWIYTVFAATHNLIALYLSYPVSWVITVIIHFVTLLIARNKAFARLEKNKGNKDNNDKNNKNDNKDNFVTQNSGDGQRGSVKLWDNNDNKDNKDNFVTQNSVEGQQTSGI
ncbi:MAG: MATE family efflux transporter [Clostridia bacterium]